MPAYDYNCQTCGASFEVVQSFSEDSLTRCPEAGSADSPAACTQPGKGQVSKVFSVPSITFKGDGFYRNDNRSGAKSSTAAKSPEGAGASGSDTSGNGDSSSSTGAKDTSTKDTGTSGGDSSSGREPALPAGPTNR